MNRPGVALFRLTLMHLLLMQGSYLLPAKSHLQGSFPISIHTSNQVTHTTENTLHSTFVVSSKMLISGNQATVCCMLITSDCTAHYVSEVNYQQNEGKMDPQS